MHDLARVCFRAVLVEERSDARTGGVNVDCFEVAVGVPGRVSVREFLGEKRRGNEGVYTRSERQ